MGESTVKPKLTTVVLNSRPSRSLAVVLTTYPMLVGTEKTLTVWFFYMERTGSFNHNLKNLGILERILDPEYIHKYKKYIYI